MSFALVQLLEDGTISVGDVTLHETQDAAVQAGLEQYGEDSDLSEDDYGR